MREVTLRQDDPDISRNSRLEVDINDYPGTIEGKITPFHLGELAYPEASFVKHAYQCTVTAPSAGRKNPLHLFGSYEIRGFVGHRVLRGDLDATDFPFRQGRIFVFDHPEQELPEDPDPIMLRILLEWCALLGKAILHRVDAGIDIRDRELVIRTDESPPTDQDVGELVRPACADIRSDLPLGDELFYQVGILFDELALTNAASIAWLPYSGLMHEKRCEAATSAHTVVATVEDSIKKR